MVDFRSIILVIVAAPLAHAQVGPIPEWIDEPAPTVWAPASASTPAVTDQPPATVTEPIKSPAEQVRPAIESMPLGAAAAQTSNDSAAPVEPHPGIFTNTILPLAAVLGLIVALAGGARAIMRAKGGLVGSLGAGGRAPSGVLEVLGRYPVARGSTLVLLKLDKRVLLVAQTRTGKLGGGAFTTLTEITDPEDVASLLLKTRNDTSESMSKRFTTMLGAFERQQPPIEHIAVPRRSERSRPASGASLPAQPVSAHEPVPDSAIASVRQRLADMRSSEVPG